MAGQIHRVPAGGAPGAFQERLDEAEHGDVFVLGPGVHRGPFAVRKTVSIVGADDPDARAVLEGDGRERVLALEGSGLTLTISGLVVRGGVSGLGAGIAVLGQSDLDATGCVFEDNRARDSGGGAVYASAGHLRFRDCVFRRNGGARGGALLLTDIALAAATNCVFQANEATSAGAVGLGGGALFTALHCTFADHRLVRDEAGMDEKGGPPGQGATFELAGGPTGRPQLRLSNSLVLSDVPDSLADRPHAPGRVVVGWSVVPADWCESAFPLATEGDVVFATASRAERGGFPTVGRGGPGAGGADWTLAVAGDALHDLLGVHRLADLRMDVGAVEADGDDGGA